MPTLSVVMANYNYSQYIGAALEAILTQSFIPAEVIVVDDASADGSVSVIRKFMDKYPNLRLLQNNKNMGSLWSVKRGIALSTGDYIYSAASDDKVLPGFFEKSMVLLAQNPQAGLCCANTRLFSDDGTSEGEVKLGASSIPCYFSPQEAFELVRAESFTPILPHTTIVKRTALNEAGGYREDLKWTCDTFAHHVIIFRYGFCYVPKVLATVRFHSKQQGMTQASNVKLERELIQLQINAIRESRYRDVFPMFRRTAAFSIFPWQVFCVVIGKRENWEFLSFKLLKWALYDKFIRGAVKTILPRKLHGLARVFINWLRKIKHLILGRYKK